jgi:hypothetical protein
MQAWRLFGFPQHCLQVDKDKHSNPQNHSAFSLFVDFTLKLDPCLSIGNKDKPVLNTTASVIWRSEQIPETPNTLLKSTRGIPLKPVGRLYSVTACR